MKRWNVKSFVAGALLMALVLGLGVPALASSTVMKELYYNNIQIRLNGKTLTPKDATGNVVEPFVIDGTTYLPIRAVASALGLNVEWDGKNQTVILGNDPEKGVPAKWPGEMETFTGTATESKIEKDGQYNDIFTANDETTYDRYYCANGDGASYLLKGQYTKFTGTFYLPKAAKNTIMTHRFLVYLDDKLVYTSNPMTSGTLPFDFEVNTTGAYKMEVVFQYLMYSDHYFGAGDDEFHNGYYEKAYETLDMPYIANAALWTD